MDRTLLEAEACILRAQALAITDEEFDRRVAFGLIDACETPVPMRQYVTYIPEPTWFQVDREA